MSGPGFVPQIFSPVPSPRFVRSRRGAHTEGSRSEDGRRGGRRRRVPAHHHAHADAPRLQVRLSAARPWPCVPHAPATRPPGSRAFSGPHPCVLAARACASCVCARPLNASRCPPLPTGATALLSLVRRLHEQAVPVQPGLLGRHMGTEQHERDVALEPGLAHRPGLYDEQEIVWPPASAGPRLRCFPCPRRRRRLRTRTHTAMGAR